MNILFVTPPPYLPNRLHRNRSFDLIRILAKNHKIHLLSVVTDKKVYPEFREIKKVCRSVKVVRISQFGSITNCIRFFYLPLEVAYCYSQKAKKEIEKIVKNKKIDLVYIKRLRSAVFLPKVDVITVIDTTDAMSLFCSRLDKNSYFPKNFFYKLESIKYQAFEKKVARKFKNWIVSSPIDAKYLQSLKLGIDIFVVPNAVDTNYFQPLNVNYEPKTILFSGLVDKPVNVDAACYFAKEIFPLVKKKVSDAKLYIVGPNPSSKVRRLANDDIVVKGFVSDIREFIAKSQIVIAPVRVATGVRNKILQAWSIGKPVVSTTIGAQGLKAVDNKNILLADSQNKFAQKIISLFENKRLYNRLSENAKKTANEEYSLGAISKKLEDVLRNVKKSKNTSWQ